MARDYTFIRQEAEALVDLLEEQPDRQLHDHTAQDMADELRKMFGMCTRAESEAIKAQPPAPGFKPAIIEIPPHFTAD